jgi:archaellum component FlaC
MALLERITQMKQQSLSDSQIAGILSEEGISPRDINEALSQSKIKSAVSTGSGEDMQPSIMSNNTESSSSAVPDSSGQMPNAPVYNQASRASVQAYAQEQQPAYPSEQYAYPEQGTYYQQSTDIETVRDVAKQVVEESLQKIKEEITTLSRMKSDLKFEIQNIENRLVRIESIIQELQSSIIRKMGQYGESIASISQEVRATQDSFSKVINPLLDKKRNVGSSSQEREQAPQEEIARPVQARQGVLQEAAQILESKAPTQRTSSTSGINVEDYFR